MTKPLTIIFLGKSGAGKGTQAHYLEQDRSFHIIGMGDLLRAFTRRKNVVAERIEKLISSGRLAPSWFVKYLWTNELMHIEPETNLVFDGSCRLMEEALMLDEVLDWFGRTPPKVLLLDISDAEATRRLLTRRQCEACKKIYLGDSLEAKSGVCPCGGKLVKRHDDQPDMIRNRLAYFQADVMPVVEHYKKKGWLTIINGEQAPEKVHEDILKHLKPGE